RGGCGVSPVPRSRYDALAPAAAPAPVPDVATGAPAPAAAALVSMNGMVGAPGTAASAPGCRSIHPESVTFLSAAVALPAWVEVGGACVAGGVAGGAWVDGGCCR